MVFTLFHPFLSLLFYLPLRLRVEFFSFFTAVILPDIEGLYFSFPALAACGSDAVCAAEYPSHYLLHSFLGVAIIAAAIALALPRIKYFNLNKKSFSLLYASAFFGGLTHLFFDLFAHRGADALALFFPLPYRFSLVFPQSLLLLNILTAVGAGLTAYLLLVKKVVL